MPKISIIVPVHKTEDKLARCVDSIINQTFNDFELILVDDGSPDNCGKICDDYAVKDNRVRVFHKENGGVASAKNYGIKNAMGEFLTFVDSDDFLDANCLLNLISVAYNCDIVISGIKYLSSDSLKPYAKLDFKNNYSFAKNDFQRHIADLLDQRALNYHVAKLYKRTIINNNNILFPDFNETGADDTVFNFEFLSNCENVSIINCCDYNYISYSNSTSHKFSPNTFSRKKALDAFLLKKTNEMNLLDDKLQQTIDKRFVLAAFWSACDFATCRDLSYFNYKKHFKKISVDERFRVAYLSIKDKTELDNGIHLIYKCRPLAFFNYANNISKKIKGAIYKYIPNSIKSVYSTIKR